MSFLNLPFFSFLFPSLFRPSAFTHLLRLALLWRRLARGVDGRSRCLSEVQGRRVKERSLTMTFVTMAFRPDFSLIRILRRLLAGIRTIERFLESPGFYGKLIP
jgi:hypothetical protein|uniref:Uncharacterized protein n=1 Tax=Leptospirillum ferrodiazotrophum TaxID=412449 RepID=C6HXP4_9BACT|nr:MAG: hypothetical protein UBAL3_93200003a [Leptospirillum ferrodiazotrophum]